MDQLNKDDLLKLAEYTDSACLTIYLPTERVEAQVAQNPIRFKNLIKKARTELVEMGVNTLVVERVLAPALDVLTVEDFWLSMRDGIAVFLAPGFSRIYRLPCKFEELVVTGRRFHLKPLLPLVDQNDRFYLLALAQNEVVLYEGTEHVFKEIDTEVIPKNIQEALWSDDAQSSHTQPQGGRRFSRAQGYVATFNGHGGQADDLIRNPVDTIQRFFEEVDANLMRVIGSEKTPLILMGVEYYQPIYKEITAYPHLVDHTIVAGNHEFLTDTEIHRKAWEVMKPILKERQDRAIESFLTAYATMPERTSDDLREIVPAAVFSRIETLVVPVGVYQWGRYDADTNQVELHDEQQPGDDDLLDMAAVHTLLNGGNVHALAPDRMPVRNRQAATFRFPGDLKADVGRVASKVPS